MAQVITDRTVQDGVFISTMLSVWRVDSGTTIRPITRNCYLAEFSEIEDMQRVQAGGAWTFRGDIVALRHVKSQTDLSPNHTGSVTLWVQFHNLPFNSLKDEGLEIMAKEIGTPVSPPVNGFYNGRRFVKFKIIIPLGVSLKDRVKLAHPTLGEITAHCVYEKAARICTYCGCIGHELVTCPDHARVTVIVHDPANSGKYNPAELLSPKKGAWITNLNLVPLENKSPGLHCYKRRHSQTHTTNSSPTSNMAEGGEAEDLANTSLDLIMGEHTQLVPKKRQRPASLNAPAKYI